MTAHPGDDGLEKPSLLAQVAPQRKRLDQQLLKFLVGEALELELRTEVDERPLEVLSLVDVKLLEAGHDHAKVPGVRMLAESAEHAPGVFWRLHNHVADLVEDQHRAAMLSA